MTVNSCGCEPKSDADTDPAAYASALYAWLAAGKSLDELVERGLTVRTGTVTHRATVTRR